MRFSFLTLFLALGCQPEASSRGDDARDAARETSSGGAAAMTGFGFGGSTPHAPSRLGATCDCLDEGCAATATEPDVLEELCPTSNVFVIVRTTYPGCDTIGYGSMTWDYAASYVIEQDAVVACLYSTPTSHAGTRRIELPATCDHLARFECLVCPEFSDPLVLDTFAGMPLCEGS